MKKLQRTSAWVCARVLPLSWIQRPCGTSPSSTPWSPHPYFLTARIFYIYTNLLFKDILVVTQKGSQCFAAYQLRHIKNLCKNRLVHFVRLVVSSGGIILDFPLIIS